MQAVLRCDALQVGIIGDQMDQDVIPMRVEELGDGGLLWMTAQNHQRRLGLGVALGIDHIMQQGDQFGPHLLAAAKSQGLPQVAAVLDCQPASARRTLLPEIAYRPGRVL
jgi:hypothetical protein